MVDEDFDANAEGGKTNRKRKKKSVRAVGQLCNMKSPDHQRRLSPLCPGLTSAAAALPQEESPSKRAPTTASSQASSNASSRRSTMTERPPALAASTSTPTTAALLEISSGSTTAPLRSSSNDLGILAGVGEGELWPGARGPFFFLFFSCSWRISVSLSSRRYAWSWPFAPPTRAHATHAHRFRFIALSSRRDAARRCGRRLH